MGIGEVPLFRGSWFVTGIGARTWRGLLTLCLLVLCLSEALCEEDTRDGLAGPAKGIPGRGGQNIGDWGALSSAAMGMAVGAENEARGTGGRRAGPGGMVSGIMTIKGYTYLTQVDRIRTSARSILEAYKRSLPTHSLPVHDAPSHPSLTIHTGYIEQNSQWR